MPRLRNSSKILASIVLSLGMISCGSDSDDDSAAASTVTTETALATAYPGGLAISVFPNESGSGLYLQDEKSGDDGEGTKTLAEKKEEADALISGEADSCLPNIFQTERVGQTVTCYEFDQEMIYGTMHQTLGTRDGTAEGAKPAWWPSRGPKSPMLKP